MCIGTRWLCTDFQTVLALRGRCLSWKPAFGDIVMLTAESGQSGTSQFPALSSSCWFSKPPLVKVLHWCKLTDTLAD